MMYRIARTRNTVNIGFPTKRIRPQNIKHKAHISKADRKNFFMS